MAGLAIGGSIAVNPVFAKEIGSLFPGGGQGDVVQQMFQSTYAGDGYTQAATTTSSSFGGLTIEGTVGASCPPGETGYGGICVQSVTLGQAIQAGGAAPANPVGNAGCPGGSLVAPGTDQAREFAGYFGVYACAPQAPGPQPQPQPPQPAGGPAPVQNPQAPPPPTGGQPGPQYGQTFVQVLVPWQYAECMRNPAQGALTADPGAGAPISPATEQDVGDGRPDPQYWSYLAQHGLTGHLLPGPGWAAQRQEQEILQWVYPPHGAPYTIVVRPPYWIAREVWDPTDCPVPLLVPEPGQAQ
ncbi:MAG: hypothetical protein K6U87_05570 [Firmicutes bacterium]|nr:hypothetical protein [Bacillota bacterium]